MQRTALPAHPASAPASRPRTAGSPNLWRTSFAPPRWATRAPAIYRASRSIGERSAACCPHREATGGAAANGYRRRCLMHASVILVITAERVLPKGVVATVRLRSMQLTHVATNAKGRCGLGHTAPWMAIDGLTCRPHRVHRSGRLAHGRDIEFARVVFDHAARAELGG